MSAHSAGRPAASAEPWTGETVLAAGALARRAEGTLAMAQP